MLLDCLKSSYSSPRPARTNQYLVSFGISSIFKIFALSVSIVFTEAPPSCYNKREFYFIKILVVSLHYLVWSLGSVEFFYLSELVEFN